ncbi:ATP-dependent translocase ABCB1 [Trichonephila clavata]|uniref:ABC-type xenobiotic transporter n=1 Tax=Trichonephila clavata TaxID=2740835 RepID=A0A8X6J905_TRICU|nr:ATP-dependent translocase ABCB1 [Trichonephila clavata]
MKFRIKLLSNLRQRFRKEYLGELIQKQNDNRVREPRVGEMVLIGDDNKKRLSWPIAKIIELIPGRDEEIRTVRLKTQHGTVIRPVQCIFPLEVQAIANNAKGLKEESNSVKCTKPENDLNTNDIEIDNMCVKDLNIGWLRSNIGFVGQEPVLFSTTIAENIRFGKDDATDEEIKRAAKFVNIHEFICNLPKKFNTLVGDRGTQLSGGQKQRIALARAIVKNPKILLLDEATSALDTESEAIVQLALDEARKGRTTIVVAHRLSTIKNADRIFVLSDGIIKEMGNHNELMESKGLYHHLVLSQMYEMENFLDDDVDGGWSALSRHVSVLTSSSFTSWGSSQDTSGLFFKELGDVKPSVSWMRLLKISLPDWPYLVVGSIAALMMGLHTPLYGVIFGSILGVLSEDIDKLMDLNIFYCIIFAIMSITSFTMSFLQTFMFSVASEKLTSRLRKEIFSKIITQDITWFDHPVNSIGSLCARLISDASDLQGASGYRISTLVQTVSTITACTFLACYFNYKLGLLVFAFVPLILMSAYFGKRLTVGDILSDKSSLEVASKVAVEAIENIRTVVSLNQIEGFYIRYTDALILPYRNTRKKSHVKGFTYAFSQSIQVFAYAATFYYGSVLIDEGELTYSDMYKSIEGVIVSIIVLGHLFAFAPDFQKAMIAAANIFGILDMKSRNNVFSSDGLNLKNVNGSISFQNVYFNYPMRPKVKVLRDLSLDIKPGKTVALVGSSGCGKSTCIQLIERFYDADAGSVLLDGIHTEKINVRNLRSHIGLVSQEPVLFSCSIAENIAYGNNFEPVDMNEVINAARRANIHNFIVSLPQGYATTVGTKGTQLSGGQKQRIAIARALLRDPKILLLDEATSALDAENEHIVQEALDNARHGRTCIIIAHRLTTIQTADSIAVIHKGRVVEQGIHQDLLKMKGYYYKLYTNQYSKKSSTDA